MVLGVIACEQLPIDPVVEIEVGILIFDTTVVQTSPTPVGTLLILVWEGESLNDFGL